MENSLNENKILMLNEINEPLTNNEQIVYINEDDQELNNALNDYQKSEILKEESNRLKESAKEIFKKRLCSKRIKYACNSDYMVKLTEFTSNRFNTSKFKNDHNELYNEYIEPISSLRITIEDSPLIK